MKDRPWRVVGTALATASMTARAFSSSCCALNEALPTGTWMLPALSILNSTRPAFHFLDRLRGVVGHGAGLRIRHEAAGPEHLAELAHFAHRLGRGDGHVEIRPAFDALLDHVVETDELGASSLGSIRGRTAFGKDENLDGLAAAVRQRNGAANHLVDCLGSHAEAEGEIDGLVELGLGELGQNFDGGLQRIRLLRIHLFECFFVSFAGHVFFAVQASR